MLMIFERARRRIVVSISDAEINEGSSEGGILKREYGFPQGLTYSFAKDHHGSFLSVSFKRFEDPGVLCRITVGQPVKETLMLWKLAHLPGVIISGHTVRLMNMRRVDLINRLVFELRKIGPDLWATDPHESEDERRSREGRLEGMAKAVPALFNERTSGEIIPGDIDSLTSETLYYTGVWHKERDIEKEALCSGCDRWHDKDEMTEVRPGVAICPECKWSPKVLEGLAISDTERFRIFHGICDGCRNVYEKEDLAFVTPGGNLCVPCLSVKGWFK